MSTCTCDKLGVHMFINSSSQEAVNSCDFRLRDLRGSKKDTELRYALQHRDKNDRGVFIESSLGPPPVGCLPR